MNLNEIILDAEISSGTFRSFGCQSTQSLAPCVSREWWAVPRRT